MWPRVVTASYTITQECPIAQMQRRCLKMDTTPPGRWFHFVDVLGTNQWWYVNYQWSHSEDSKIYKFTTTAHYEAATFSCPKRNFREIRRYGSARWTAHARCLPKPPPFATDVSCCDVFCTALRHGPKLDISNRAHPFRSFALHRESRTEDRREKEIRGRNRNSDAVNFGLGSGHWPFCARL